MTKNVGNLDRIVRTIVGPALIGWGLYSQGWWGAIGAILLITALVSWCQMYLPLGIRTNK